MTFFCPNCGNLLIAEEGTTIYFKCCSCPYKFVFNKKVQDETKLKRKEVDAVIGEDAFKNAPKAESTCEKCGCKETYYYQLQIRSADEPMTTFYQCCKCGFNWRDG